MGSLSTHILDTAQGVPAEGILCRLYSLRGERALLKTLVTNSDGRTDALLLNQAEFQLGGWELVFNVAEYFKASGLNCDEPPFLDEITLRVNLSRDTHYHVPLLVSPWSYSTYRGS